MAGITPNGLEVRTQAELQTLIEDEIAAALPGVNVRAGPMQQFASILSEELAIAWEAIAALYAGVYPDSATGILLDQASALTGTLRRAATRSRVTASVNLNAGVTLPAGSIAAVTADPDAQFRTTAAATNSGGSPDDVDVEMESVDTGPVAAPTGTLEVIVTPVSGWNSVTNAADAELGRDLAEDAELRTQRVVELAGRGSDSYAAIRAAVAAVDDVLEVQVLGNESLTTDGDGRPGKSFEAIVWDGDPTGADDDEIAQAIWDAKPAGILAHGVGETGDATTGTGATIAVEFTRATALRVYVDCEVVLAEGTGAGWEDEVAAAIAARAELYSVGETAYASQLVCAVIDAVPSVVAVTTLTVGLIATPITALVEPDYSEIVRIDTADVDAAEA